MTGLPPPADASTRHSHAASVCPPPGQLASAVPAGCHVGEPFDGSRPCCRRAQAETVRFPGHDLQPRVAHHACRHLIDGRTQPAGHPFSGKVALCPAERLRRRTQSEYGFAEFASRHNLTRHRDL